MKHEETEIPTDKDYFGLVDFAKQGCLDQEWVDARLGDHGFDPQNPCTVAVDGKVFMNTTWKAMYAVHAAVKEIIDAGKAATQEDKKLGQLASKLKKKAKKAGLTDQEILAFWGGSGCATNLSTANIEAFGRMIDEKVAPEPPPVQAQPQVLSSEMLEQVKFHYAQVEKAIALNAIKRNMAEQICEGAKHWFGNEAEADKREQLAINQLALEESKQKINTLVPMWQRLHVALLEMERKTNAESISPAPAGAIGAS